MTSLVLVKTNEQIRTHRDYTILSAILSAMSAIASAIAFAIASAILSAILSAISAQTTIIVKQCYLKTESLKF